MPSLKISKLRRSLKRHLPYVEGIHGCILTPSESAKRSFAANLPVRVRTQTGGKQTEAKVIPSPKAARNRKFVGRMKFCRNKIEISATMKLQSNTHGLVVLPRSPLEGGAPAWTEIA
jgi:hypothetical protein